MGSFSKFRVCIFSYLVFTAFNSSPLNAYQLDPVFDFKDRSESPYSDNFSINKSFSAMTEDPLREKSWHLFGANIYSAWSYTTGSPRTVIAVVDSGYDYLHPELQTALWKNPNEIPADGIDNDSNGYIDDTMGWNYVNGKWGIGNNDPMDKAGHGTFIAGLIAATPDNGIGGLGVCPDCKIMPVRFLNGDGLGDEEDSLLAIKYAVVNNASVINFSFAGEGYDKEFHDLLLEALKRDIVIVAAAGNDGENNDTGDTYPANFSLPNMLTVAATYDDGSLWERSNWGHKKVHIAAPGARLVGPWVDNDYWLSAKGTSFAAPIVAAVAGLIRSANPSLKAIQVVAIIQATAKKSEHLKSKIKTGGIVDAGAAVRCALDPLLTCLSMGKRKGNKLH